MFRQKLHTEKFYMDKKVPLFLLGRKVKVRNFVEKKNILTILLIHL
jgi:hypothetical protein